MLTPKFIADKTLFALAIGLVLLGVVMVYSSSAVMAAEKFHSQYYFLVRQSIWAVLAFAAMMLTMSLDYHLYQRWWVVWLGLLVSVVLLVAVFFFPAVNGAHRWIRVRSFSFQPSELAKFTLILFLAYQLDRRIPSGIKHFWLTFFPCAVVAGVMMGLIALEPDLGMALSLGLILVALLSVARVPLKQQALLALGVLPALYWLLFHVNWRLERVITFFDPWQDPQGRGFQAIQSLIALGSGGLTGVGFAQGKQKLFFLPEPHTDFIFSQIGEELGLIGTGFIVAAFGIILWRGLRISLLAPDGFGMLLGIGIVIAIVMQAFLNMSVAAGLLPIKGMPLPLVSYGGSALLLTLAEIGLLLNIAQQVRRDGV